MSSYNLQFVSPADRKRGGGKFITLDRQARLMLSTGYRLEIAPLEVKSGIPFSIYVAYDPASKVIAVVRSDKERMVPDALTYKVDRRGYFSGKILAEKLGIDIAKGSYRLEFVGKVDSHGAYLDAFKLVQPE